MPVTNTLEEVVPSLVARLVEPHEHIRSCEACTDDVVALTLSGLAPGYASTDMGRILKRLDIDKASGRARITVAALTAIDVIKQNPHHTK